MKVLNVLYQSNDLYAPITGVSMTSLMENNQDLDDIRFYILNDNIKAENIKKFHEVCAHYGRTLILIETERMLKELRDELKVSPLKGTYTTYFKLLALKELDLPTDRILYLDGDTIITGSLAPLLDINMDGHALAATYACFVNSYKPVIGIPLTDKTFNCGVMLVNQAAWIEKKYEEQIFYHLKNVRSRYWTVDQDIINVLFRHEILYLDMTYNFKSCFYIYGIKECLKLYELTPEVYESYEKITEVSKNPIIHHCAGATNGRPWEKGNTHPLNDLFDEYAKMSPWHKYEKTEKKQSFSLRLQKTAQRVLPKPLYLFLLRHAQKMVLRKNDVQG